MKPNFCCITLFITLVIGFTLSNSAADPYPAYENISPAPQIQLKNLPAINSAVINLEPGIQIGGNSTMLTMHGNYALTTEGPNMIILDATNPEIPQILSQTKITFSLLKFIEIVNHYAFVVSEYNGIFIMDITDPAHPQQIYNIPPEHSSLIKALYSYGYLYVCSKNKGIDVYNAANLENPQYITNIYANSYDFCISGNTLFINEFRKITVWDLTDPANAQLLTTIHLENNSSSMVKAIGNYLYAMDGQFLRIYNISNIQAISPVSSVQLGVGYPIEVTQRNNRLYVTTEQRIYFIDITDMNNPVIIKYMIMRGRPVDFDLNGNYAYITFTEKSIKTFDISVQDTLIQTANWTSKVPIAYSLFLDQNADNVYIASEYNGWNVFNITEPSFPEYIINYDNSFPAKKIMVKNNYAYINYSSTCHIVNIANPFAPQFSTLIEPGNAMNIINMNIHSNFLYLLTDPNGLTVYDITNPESPSFVAQTNNPDDVPKESVIKYPYMYVVDYYNGFYIYDITNPANPILRSTLPISSSAHDLVIYNNYAYVLKLWSLDINIIDISDPDQPVMADSFATRLNYPVCLHEYNDLLYVGGNSGFQAFDLSDPSSPEIAMEPLQLSGTVRDILAIDNILYAANDVLGLLLYEIQQKEIPAGIHVTNTQDSGPGSFRAAIELANANIGPDTIRFAIPLSDEHYESSGYWQIITYSPLPFISDDNLVILGNSQKEFLEYDPNPLGPEIAISGQLAVSEITNGLIINANNVEISGLVIYHFSGKGIFAAHVDNLRVWDCYLGISPTGGQNGANDTGIHLWDHCTNCVIGSSNEHPYGNVISNNKNSGIFISDSSSFNIIENNIIGLNQEKTEMTGNGGAGIALQNNANNNQISHNIICNNYNGIQIYDCNNTLIQSNQIGSLEDWQHDWGNDGNGISIYGESKYNSVKYNIVAFNGMYGIEAGNEGALYNTISENAIAYNKNKGISTQWGGNRELAPPVISSVIETTISGITGSLYTVEVFNDEANQGRIYLGTTIANGAGEFQFTIENPLTFAYITATATDDSGNTSAFSNNYKTEIKDIQTEILPERYAVQKNYPNPFNSNTRIPYQLKEKGHLTLTIYNITGQKVRTLVDMQKQAGFHEIVWNGKTDTGLDLPSGTYLLHFKVNGFTDRQKLLYLK